MDKIPPFKPQPMQAGQTVAIDLKNAVQLACECGNGTFNQQYVVFRIPALVSPTGQDLIVHQTVYSCSKCHSHLDPKKGANNDGPKQ